MTICYRAPLDHVMCDMLQAEPSFCKTSQTEARQRMVVIQAAVAYEIIMAFSISLVHNITGEMASSKTKRAPFRIEPLKHKVELDPQYAEKTWKVVLPVIQVALLPTPCIDCRPVRLGRCWKMR